MGQGFERGLEQAERQVIRSRRQTLRPKVDSLFPTPFHFSCLSLQEKHQGREEDEAWPGKAGQTEGKQASHSMNLQMGVGIFVSRKR
jgi:hypothetical protein